MNIYPLYIHTQNLLNYSMYFNKLTFIYICTNETTFSCGECQRKLKYICMCGTSIVCNEKYIHICNL